MTSTERSKRCRARAAVKRVPMTVDVPLYKLAEALIDGEFTEAWNADDPTAVAAAFQRCVDWWLR